MLKKLLLVFLMLPRTFLINITAIDSASIQGPTLAVLYKPWASYPHSEVLVPIAIANTTVNKKPIELKSVVVSSGNKVLGTSRSNKTLPSILKEGINETI